MNISPPPTVFCTTGASTCGIWCGAPPSEEAAYLLLFGELPNEAQLQDFCGQLASYRTLPTNFFRDVIMKNPPRDLMNTMQRGILTLFCYDDKPNDIGLENVLRQCLQLMSNMPVLAIYAYQAWRFSQGESLFIHVPKPELSTAENFLRMLREDCSYTDLEARTLDVALILHADNGGGNNSTFTNHVVTSSGTDTYSAIAASMASLKGPRHGGANSKVMAMMDDVKEHVRDWNDEGCVADYLTRILNKDAFDRSGLIYGLGHAVYTKTDPRCEVFRAYVNHLAAEKGREDELALYANVEKIGKQLLMTRGSLTTFSIANDVAKYFAIVPALFIASIPSLQALNIMHLHSPESAILSAVIFNAVIIPLLIPLALRGVTYKPIGASALLRRNLFIYGLGGIIVPFIGIKLIDMLVSVFF